MERIIDRSVLVGLGGIVALLLGSAVLSVYNTHRLDQAAVQVAHTRKVQDLTANTLRLLVDAETGMRGFVITGKDEYLQPYDEATKRLDGQLAAIDEATRDNSGQQERIRRLREMAAAVMANLKESIDLRRKSEKQAQDFIAAGQGKTQMDAIRRLIDEMEAEEGELLPRRQGHTRNSYQVAVGTGLLSAALGLFMVGAFFRQLHRDLTARQQAAAALRREQEWLQTTLSSIGDAVIATDTAGKITFLNPVAVALTGWSEDAIGQPLETVFHIINEKTRQPAENPAARALREGVVVGLANHTLLVARDGTERPIDDSAAPIRDEDGLVAGVVLVFRNVSPRREAEKAARLLTSIFASSEDAIIGKDVNGIITNWNPAAERLFGYSAAEAIGHPIVMLAPPDRADEMPALLARIRRGERIEHFDTVRRAKDGRLLSISLTISPIKDEEGVIIGASKIARDVSDRKRSEEALRQSEQRWRTVTETLPNLIWSARPDGHFDWVSSQWSRYIGLPEKDLLGTRWMATLHPDDRERTRAGWQAACADQGGYDLGYRIRRNDGEYHWFKTRGVPIRDDTGRIVYWFGTCTDIEDAKRLEAALREADRRKNEFLATLSHELRNPLAPIRNGLRILRLSGPQDPDRSPVLDMLERQVTHMVCLVDDLMDVSRITRGKVELRKDRLDVIQVVQNAVETSRPLIDAGKHELTVALPPQPVTIVGDSTRLTQVVANLLNNAARYTPEGGRIRLTVEKEQAQVVIRVRDNGVGIPSDMLSKIFDMFTQVDHALDRTQGGLGLGLTLVQQLVERHGGTVEARSEGADKGSEFCIRLPLAPRTATHQATRPVQAENGEENGPARRILVVDDNRDAAESLALLLRLTGNVVEVAYNGPSAIESVRDFRPHVVLLDIGMPGMNGFDVAKHLRELPDGQGLVLVAQTGWGQEDDRRRSREAGFDAHLVKPVELSAIQQLLAVFDRPRQ